MELKRVFAPLELKAADDAGVVEGYGSVFGNEDSYGDIVAKGAFVESLTQHKAKGTNPAMLWQHNPDWPVGRWLELSEDDSGLKMRGQLNLKTTRGIEAFEHIKAGDISGLSIGFMTRSYQFDEETSIRTLTAVDLWEVSLVTFPANELARIQETRASDEIVSMSPSEIERMLREERFFSRKQATAIVSRLMAIGAQREAGAVQEAKTIAALNRLRAAMR